MLLLNGLALSTRMTHNKSWCFFVVFCACVGLSSELPISERVLCYFVAKLSGTCAFTSIKVTVAAVQSGHVDLGFKCDTINMVTLKRVMEGSNTPCEGQNDPASDYHAFTQ